jgi:uncharacterized protein
MVNRDYYHWTDWKAGINLKAHGVSFDEASTVFEDPLAICFPDPKHSESEDRLILVGYSAQERLLFVSHQELDDHIRIISARFATPPEKKRHEQYN